MAEDTRFESLEKDVPFLKTLNDSTVDKIINIITNKNIHHMIEDSRLDKMKSIVEQLKKKFNDKNQVIMENKKYLKCIVANCISNSNKNVDRSYYILPKDEERRNKWLKAMNISATSLLKKKRHYVCEIHFVSEDHSSVILKRTAVPSLYLNKFPPNSNLNNHENGSDNTISEKSLPKNVSDFNIDDEEILEENNFFHMEKLATFNDPTTSQGLKQKSVEKIVEVVELDSSNEDEDTTPIAGSKNFNKKDDSNDDISDKDVEFYQITEPSIKVKPPNPTKCEETNMKIKQKEHLDSESDLKIISEKAEKENLENDLKTMQCKVIQKSKENLRNINVKIKENFFGKRNDKQKTSEKCDTDSNSDTEKDHSKSKELDNKKKSTIPETEYNVIDSDPESPCSHAVSLVALDSGDLNEIATDYISQERVVELNPKDPLLVESTLPSSSLVPKSLVTMDQIIQLNELMNQSNKSSTISEQIISPSINPVNMDKSIPSIQNFNTLLPVVKLYQLQLPVSPVLLEQPLPKIVNSFSINNPIIECSKIPTASIPPRIIEQVPKSIKCIGTNDDTISKTSSKILRTNSLDQQDETNRTTKKNLLFATKNQKLKGLSDSSSEDDDNDDSSSEDVNDFNQKVIDNQKITEESNNIDSSSEDDDNDDSCSEDVDDFNQKAIGNQKITEESNNMENNLNQNEGNEKLCDVVIEALRKDYAQLLSEIQLVNIENIVKQYTKGFVCSSDSLKKGDSALGKKIIQKETEPEEFGKVSRSVRSKSTTENDSILTQDDSDYDSDNFLINLKNKNAKLKIPLTEKRIKKKDFFKKELRVNVRKLKLKNMENKEAPILKTLAEIPVLMKSKETPILKPLTISVRKLKLKDTENKEAPILEPLAEIPILMESKEASILKPLIEMSVLMESKESPILKPLAEMPITVSEERERKNNNNNNEQFRNTDSNHHCLNPNFMRKCIICDEITKDVVSHYVHSHSEHKNHEVYCARLPYFIIQKFEENPIIGRTLQTKPFKGEVQCIFCSVMISGSHVEFYEHYAIHTGEYAWECSGCNKKSAYKKQVVQHCKNFCKDNGNPTRIYVYKKQNQINATYCTECNYVQLNKANVIRHLINQHSIARQPQRLCENLILVKFFEASPTESLDGLDALSDSQCEEDSIVDMAYIEPHAEERIRISNEASLDSAYENNDEIDIEIKMEELREIFSMHTSATESRAALSKNESGEIEIENSKVDYVQNANTEVCDYDDEVIYIDSNSENGKKEEDCASGSTISLDAEVILDSTEINKTQLKAYSSMNFKKKSPLKPWLDCDDIDRMKSLEILYLTNLSDFFKCMICPFSTNSTDKFRSHIKKHYLDNVIQNVTINIFDCCYCCSQLKSPEELVNHIKTEHNGSNFQCSKCFYRSCSSFSVKMHIQTYHKKDDKIIACDGADISILDQFKIITENRQKYFKPFECHLCNGGERSKFYLAEDIEIHFRNNHYNATFCRCNYHELLCCLFCHYETNFLDKIKKHMVDFHSNREQYVAARFKNIRFQYTVSSAEPNSTVIVFLSEVLSEQNFVELKTLKKKLKKANEMKEQFKKTAAKAGVTLWNVKHLLQKLGTYKNLIQRKDCDKSTVPLEVSQKEFFEMAKHASSNTGLIVEELYKCPILQCQSFFKDYELWFNHVKTQHNTFLYRNLKCPHCDEIHKIEEFNNHFNIKHLIHKYFCYLCGTSNSTKTASERHLQMEHRVSGTRTEILSTENYSEEFFAVVPNEIFCDITTLTLHMRNVLRAPKYYVKAKNSNEHSNKILNTDSLKLPKYVPVGKELYECPEQNCPFTGQSENVLENHFKLNHTFIKSFKCRHCTFNIKEEIQDFDKIRNHIRMHNEILYVCTKCKFYDHQQQILQKHIRSEHKLQMNMTKVVRSFRNEEEQFSYETCLEEGYIFLSLSFCLICEKELHKPDTITDHMKENHSVSVVYECQHCEELYSTLDAIIYHNHKHNKVIHIRCKFDYKISRKSVQIPVENTINLIECSDLNNSSVASEIQILQKESLATSLTVNFEKQHRKINKKLGRPALEHCTPPSHEQLKNADPITRKYFEHRYKNNEASRISRCKQNIRKNKEAEKEKYEMKRNVILKAKHLKLTKKYEFLKAYLSLLEVKKYLKCIVANCISNSNKNVDLSYYSLPKSEERRNKWLKAMNISETSLLTKKSHLVCELHFVSEDHSIVTLKRDAVPSLYLNEYPANSNLNNHENGSDNIIPEKSLTNNVSDFNIDDEEILEKNNRFHMEINELPTGIIEKTSKNLVNKRSIIEESTTTTTTTSTTTTTTTTTITAAVRNDKPTKKLKRNHTDKGSVNMSIYKERSLPISSSFLCENCPFRCNTEEELNKHKLMERLSKTTMKYSCKICSLEFEDISAAIRHDLIYHPKPITSETPSVSTTTVGSLESSQIYRCEFCEFTSNSIDSVKEHINNKHDNDVICVDNEIDSIDSLCTTVNKSSSRISTPPSPTANVSKIRVKPIESLISPSLTMVIIPKLNIENNDVNQYTESSQNVFNIPPVIHHTSSNK